MEVKEKIKKSNFTLPDEVITVKFIPRKKGMAANVDDNHVIAGGMLPNAVIKYMAPLQRNGSIANILSKEEKLFLEDVTGQNLSVYGDFWTSFTVSLHKEDTNNIFYMNEPMDYISVKILEANNEEIASSWSERHNKATYSFVITRPDELVTETRNVFNVKNEAFKLYNKIEDDKDKLLSVLKLMSKKPISSDSKLAWLKGEVGAYVDSESEKFVNLLNDSSFETKALIEKAVDYKIIIKKNNKYSTIDGLELADNGQVPSFNNAVKYLDNDKNQEVKSLIEARIEKIKK